nr:ATP synthase subunit 6 [Hesionides sp. PA-2020]
MMLDIFSSFDPYIFSSFKYSPLSFWMLVTLILSISQTQYWISPSKLFWMSSLMLDIMHKQSARTQSYNLKGLTSILSSLFVVIILINFVGLMPYTFSLSSHLVFTLPLGLSMWFSLILSSAFFSPKSFTASLLPGGAPDWLNPFLVLVETISIMARPITLSFRLAANMTAGHIILGLIGVYASAAILSNSFAMLPLLLTQTGYIIFEVGICLIQAYIFCLLLTLYADEHAN